MKNERMKSYNSTGKLIKSNSKLSKIIKFLQENAKLDFHITIKF